MPGAFIPTKGVDASNIRLNMLAGTKGRKIMIQKYTKKDGTVAWLYKIYLGVDPITNKKCYTTKRGFATQKEAKLALSRKQLEVSNKGLFTSEVSTFREIYELWFEHYRNRVKESTLFVQKWTIGLHILPLFGDLKVNRITIIYCQKQVDH